MNYQISRTHEAHIGHRVYGHESKCANLHGHSYVFTFTCTSDHLDSLGRIIDFSVVKSRLCQWIEDNWDHRLLLWEGDPWLSSMRAIDRSVVAVPFNPTAEKMAEYIVEEVGPRALDGLNVRLTACRVEETTKCWASYCR